jgi:ATP-dependent protease Clp ATPase subunit
VTNIINFTEPQKVQRKCSFCGKTEHQVEQLVSNNKAGKDERNICNECIGKANELLKEVV